VVLDLCYWFFSVVWSQNWRGSASEETAVSNGRVGNGIFGGYDERMAEKMECVTWFSGYRLKKNKHHLLGGLLQFYSQLMRHFYLLHLVNL